MKKVKYTKLSKVIDALWLLTILTITINTFVFGVAIDRWSYAGLLFVAGADALLRLAGWYVVPAELKTDTPSS